jgi:hypothetical protein
MSDKITCPKCGHKFPDQDGFGFIGQCEACGFCNHPSQSMAVDADIQRGKWVCDICGKEVGE